MGMQRHDRMLQVHGDKASSMGLSERGMAGQRSNKPTSGHENPGDTTEKGRCYSGKGRDPEATWGSHGVLNWENP